MLCLICPDWLFLAQTLNPGIKMTGLKAYVPLRGRLRLRSSLPQSQSSSEDFGCKPWNSIPGRSGRSTDHPQRLARWSDRLKKIVRRVTHLMPKLGGWVVANTPNPGIIGWLIANTPNPSITMTGLKAYVPLRGRLWLQSSSEDFGYEPWNSIPGRSRRSTDHPHQFMRSPHNPHQFMGWVAPPNSLVGGWVMAYTPPPGIKMTGLKAHVPAGQFPQSSSEDFGYEPWNSIPGRSRQLTDHPHQFMRSPHNPQPSPRSPGGQS